MPAILRVLEGHSRGNLGLIGECESGQKRVIAGVDDKQWQGDPAKPVFARRTGIVIVGIPKTMKRCGDRVVKFKKRAGIDRFGPVDQPRMLLGEFLGLDPECPQKRFGV